MLAPKRVLHRKSFKGRIHGTATRGTSLAFGAHGLKALEPGRITARQIEAARRAIVRHIRRQGKIWIRLFQMYLSVQSLPKCVWVKVKVHKNIGVVVLSQGV